MNNKVGIITLGCRVNQYESSALAELLEKNGFSVSTSENGCGHIIVNTCAVTAESERKSRQAVRRAAKKARVAVIGCASQLGGYTDIPNVFFVCGCRDKAKAVEALINDVGGFTDARCSMEGAPYEELSVSGMSPLFSECRAFLKIQDGCNGKCSYCIIPKCRGSVRSRPMGEIIAEAERLCRSGYREIILTGIETAAYNGAPLHELIAEFSEMPGLERVRLGSLTPGIITDKLLSAASDSKNFMPHFHLSLQSCSDRILAGMRRPYTKNEIFERVGKIRTAIPEAQLSADIIVGFPGESEEDFRETAEAIDALSLFHIHSFPYSEREGTEAASMPGSIPVSVRHERNRRLIAESERVKERIIGENIGKSAKILVEKINNGFALGHTEQFFEARVKDRGYRVGDIVEVDIMSYNGDTVEANARKTEEKK